MLCLCYDTVLKGGRCVDSKEEQADVEDDPDEEDMGDVNLDYERVKDNDGGEDKAKELLHSKRWDVYVN